MDRTYHVARAPCAMHHVRETNRWENNAKPAAQCNRFFSYNTSVRDRQLSEAACKDGKPRQSFIGQITRVTHPRNPKIFSLQEQAWLHDGATASASVLAATPFATIQSPGPQDPNNLKPP
jgi:hypothetical protein